MTAENLDEISKIKWAIEPIFGKLMFPSIEFYDTSQSNPSIEPLLVIPREKFLYSPLITKVNRTETKEHVNWIKIVCNNNFSIIINNLYKNINYKNKKSDLTPKGEITIYYCIYNKIFGPYSVNYEIQTRWLKSAYSVITDDYLLLHLNINKIELPIETDRSDLLFFTYNYTDNNYCAIYNDNNNNNIVPMPLKLPNNEQIRDAEVTATAVSPHIFKILTDITFFTYLSDESITFYFITHEKRYYFIENIESIYNLIDDYASHEIQLIKHDHFINMHTIENNLQELLESIKLVWFPLENKITVKIKNDNDNDNDEDVIIINIKKHRLISVYKFQIHSFHYLYNDNNKKLYLLFNQYLNNDSINFDKEKLYLDNHNIFFDKEIERINFNKQMFYLSGCKAKLDQSTNILQINYVADRKSLGIPIDNHYYLNIIRGVIYWKQPINQVPDIYGRRHFQQEKLFKLKKTNITNTNIINLKIKNMLYLEDERSKRCYFLSISISGSYFIITDDLNQTTNNVVDYHTSHQSQHLLRKENVISLRNECINEYNTIFTNLNILFGILKSQTTTTKESAQDEQSTTLAEQSTEQGEQSTALAEQSIALAEQSTAQGEPWYPGQLFWKLFK